MIKINNYSFLKYLSYYDLVYKYNLKSIYLVPQINKISLKIAIEQNSAVNLKTQYKAFLFYYLSNFCCSKIILNFFTSLKKKLKTMSLKSRVIIDISYKKIFDFLISVIFFLNNKQLESKCTQTFSSLNYSSGKPQHQCLYLIFSTPASVFFNKTNKTNQQINFNDLTVFFNFTLKKPILVPFNFLKVENFFSYTNLFKNIFIFWALKF